MGADVHRRAPSAAQLVAMETILRQSLAAGALGFSSSNGVAHMDGDGEPVPSKAAGDDELRPPLRRRARVPGHDAGVHPVEPGRRGGPHDGHVRGGRPTA